MRAKWTAVLLALVVTAILPTLGCAKLVSTPYVAVTWTPSGDSEGEEFPTEAVVTQTVEYDVGGSGSWTPVPGAEDVEYLGAGVGHRATWTLPDTLDYKFRVALRVLWQGVEFVRYCETETVRYFAVGEVDCAVEERGE
jgi:hypothetical protein